MAHSSLVRAILEWRIFIVSFCCCRCFCWHFVQCCLYWIEIHCNLELLFLHISLLLINRYCICPLARPLPSCSVLHGFCLFRLSYWEVRFFPVTATFKRQKKINKIPGLSFPGSSRLPPFTPGFPYPPSPYFQIWQTTYTRRISVVYGCQITRAS